MRATTEEGRPNVGGDSQTHQSSLCWSSSNVGRACQIFNHGYQKITHLPTYGQRTISYLALSLLEICQNNCSTVVHYAVTTKGLSRSRSCALLLFGGGGYFVQSERPNSQTADRRRSNLAICFTWIRSPPQMNDGHFLVCLLHRLQCLKFFTNCIQQKPLNFAS